MSFSHALGGLFVVGVAQWLGQGWAKCAPRAACGPRVPFVRPADSSKRNSMCGPLKSPETLEYFKFPLYGWEYLSLQTVVLTDECC